MQRCIIGNKRERKKRERVTDQVPFHFLKNCPISGNMKEHTINLASSYNDITRKGRIFCGMDLVYDSLCPQCSHAFFPFLMRDFVPKLVLLTCSTRFYTVPKIGLLYFHLVDVYCYKGRSFIVQNCTNG